MGRGTEQSRRQDDSMTQQERQERSRQKIFSAAMEEFGSHGYENVTMECICANHNISKGMMYHYYSNTDELFLLCVQDTFHALKDYIAENAQKPDGQNALDVIKNFIMLREYFIELHPQRKRIFETAIFYPPIHLAEQINLLHEPITQFNQEYLRDVIAHMSLRPGVNPDSVIRILEGIEFLLRSTGYRCPEGQETDELNTVLTFLQEVLDIVLFGILCKEN